MSNILEPNNNTPNAANSTPNSSADGQSAAPPVQKPISHAVPWKILHWGPYSIGIIGLAEREWLETLPRIPATGLIYLDFIEEGRRLARQLKSEMKCHLVVALTHMRQPNDLRLSREVPEIDLVLGGHDHFKSAQQAIEGDSAPVIKSGTDFRNFSLIKLFFKANPVTGDKRTAPPANQFGQSEIPPGSSPSAAAAAASVPLCPQANHYLPPAACHPPLHLESSTFYFTVDQVDVIDSIPPDQPLQRLITSLVGEVDSKLQMPIGHVYAPLDTTFDTVRTAESNVGSLTADILRRYYPADIGFLCGGSIRADEMYELDPSTGRLDITMQMIMDTYPFTDSCCVIQISFQQLIEALENGFSAVPKLDGRFPQLSGVRAKFCPTDKPGRRLREVLLERDQRWITRAEWESDAQLLSTPLTVCTREYLANGGDNYQSFKRGQVVLDGEQCLGIPTMLRGFFQGIHQINVMVEKEQARLKEMGVDDPLSNEEYRLAVDAKLREFKLIGVQPSEVDYRVDQFPIQIKPDVRGRILRVTE